MATTKLADITLTKQTGTTLSLSTEGKYVEDNLVFGLAVQSATTDSNTASASIEKESTDSASLGGINIYSSLGTRQTSEPSSGYYIRLKATASGSSKITGAGWIQTGALPAASTTASFFFPVTGSTVTQNKPTIDTSTGLVSATASVTAGYTPALTTSANTLQLSTVTATTVTPTEEAQTAVASGKYTLGAIKVAAISSSYVGSAIPRRTSANLSASGSTITALAGYYASNATFSVSAGSVTMNNISLNSSTGLITSTASVSEGYVTASTPSKTLQLTTMAGSTKYATTSNQTISTTGKYMLGDIVVSKLTGTGFDASNVRDGVTINVNNGNADIFTAVGNFTDAATVSSGQTAATTATILNGYSAWVDGAEVKGGIANGVISNNVTGGSSVGTINRGQQIKIGKGYYANDAYYTAQSNSGTTTITTSNSAQTTISVDGKENVFITGIKVPKDKTFTLNVEADTAIDTTSNISVTNNAYRQLIVTNSGNSTFTNSGNLSVASASTSTGNLTVSAYNSSGTAENNKSIVSGGKWVSTSVNNTGTFYGRVTVNAGSASTPATTVTANPTISVSSAGLITATASATQSVTPTVAAGYISSGTAGTVTVSGVKTQQLATQAATTFTPSTSNQTIGSGIYLTGVQTIKGDSNLAVGNIKHGVSIFGKTGTFTKANTVSSGQTAATTATILPGYSAWVDGQEVKGNITLKSAHTYTPGTTNQVITPDVYLSGAQTILGDANLISDNIRDGVTLFGVEGSCVEGSAVTVVETLDVHGGTIVTITSTNEVYGTAEEVGF